MNTAGLHQVNTPGIRKYRQPSVILAFAITADNHKYCRHLQVNPGCWRHFRVPTGFCLFVAGKSPGGWPGRLGTLTVNILQCSTIVTCIIKHHEAKLKKRSQY
jgi:hypothetical protein